MNAKRLIAPFLVAGLVGCAIERPQSSDLVVSIGDRSIAFPVDQWRAMANEVEFAHNFEAVASKPPRQYQIVTVFLNQMSEDRRSGRPIAADEYLELFLSNPNEITVLVRRDHGSYWLLSREMFRGVSVPGVEQGQVRSLTDVESDHVAASLRAEIDSTRLLLGEQLRAR